MAIHSRLLHNGQILEASAPLLHAGQLGLLAGWGVFTTLRIQDGFPFAWERHWARLTKDARLLNVEMPARPEEIYNDLLRLVHANGKPNCTLRLNIVRNGGGMWEDRSSFRQASDVIALTGDSKQWGESVRLSIEPRARYAASEFAGAKILSWAQNLTWAERAQRAGFDETILLNEHDRVAECTSANIFAVCGCEVRTPPLTEGCLPGITREVLLNEIRLPDVRIVEHTLSISDLLAAESAFITSSTRDLLRISEIEGQPVGNRGEIRERLSAAFRDFVNADILRRKPMALSA